MKLRLYIVLSIGVKNNGRKFASNLHQTEKNNIHSNPNAVYIYFIEKLRKLIEFKPKASTIARRIHTQNNGEMKLKGLKGYLGTAVQGLSEKSNPKE